MHRRPKAGCNTSNFYKATRSSLTAPFGNVQLADFPGYENLWEDHCFVTHDEKILYFYSDQGTAGEGIWVSHRVKKDTPCLPR